MPTQPERSPEPLPPTLAADDPTVVDRACAELRRGEAVVLPTDTVYGVAALPSVDGATERLFALKDRADRRPLAVLVADDEQGLALAQDPTRAIRRIARRYWPGPLTLVLTRTPEAGALDLGGDPATIGVRCPDHALVRAIAARVGPVATTSANRSGEPTPVTALGAAAALAGPVALVVDGGPLPGTPSTVIDGSADEWVILRHGPVSLVDLRAAAAGGDEA